MELTLKSKKTIGNWLCGGAAVLSLIILIVYCVYTSGLGILNSLVILSMLFTIAVNAINFMVCADLPFDILGLLEIGAAASTAYSLVTFLRASINNLADLLNGIQIFSGGTGSIPAIFTILIALLVIGIAEIAACFAGTK